jgi:hypothetical protein
VNEGGGGRRRSVVRKIVQKFNCYFGMENAITESAITSVCVGNILITLHKTHRGYHNRVRKREQL